MIEREEFKICNKCGERKPILEYRIHTWRRDGTPVRLGTCKTCQSAIDRARRPRKEGYYREMTSNGEIKLFQYKNGKRSLYWSADDERKFRELYPHTPMDELIEIFEMTEGSLRNRAHQMGLHKDPAYLRNLSLKNLVKGRKYLERHPPEQRKHIAELGIATRFKKGQQTIPPEKQAEYHAKGWETRRRNALRMRREETVKQLKQAK